MKILIAASEAIPFAKTGGLADVAGSLLRAYRKASDVEAYLMLPLYRGIAERFDLRDTGVRIRVPVGPRWYEGAVWSHSSAFFLECGEFFDRPELYGPPEGDYPDNAARFVFFSRGVLEACSAMGLKPDVIHCNDWQTGLIPLYLDTLYRSDFFKGTAVLMTVHNLGYQGLFGVSDFHLTGLGREWFRPEGIEFYGKVNFLKAGLLASDMITTVSETYAAEILTPDQGHGLDGVLRNRSKDIVGVVNGIDTEEWDPRTDALIPANFGSSEMKGKDACRKSLMQECGFGRAGKDLPLVALVGRLSEQKGVDIFLDSMGDLISMGARIVVLGKGDAHLQEGLSRAAEEHGESVHARIGYDEAFAHRVYAGSDIFLMPSKYEPCGLGQMIAMRYGTVPVARRTGGLADTITDYDVMRRSGTGFLFEEYKASALRECMKRALGVYTDRRRWKGIIAAAMESDFSWEVSAKKYLDLYARAAAVKGASER